MKTVTQTMGRAQALLDISFDLQKFFKECLTDEYKTFLHLLRATEEYTSDLVRPYAGTGRPPYPYISFFRENRRNGILTLKRQAN
jgi:hypothetical protein